MIAEESRGQRLVEELVEEEFPKSDAPAAMERFVERFDPGRALEGEQEMAKVWEEKARSSPTRKDYEKRVAEIWREIGCAAEGAPYVLRRLLARLQSEISPFDAQSPHLPALAAAFLDGERCPGARGLTDDEKAKLKEIRDRSTPPSSKQ